jgi:hypothetical protein
MDKYFKQEDKQKVIEFMNFIGVKAEFNGWKTEDTIKHFGLLSYMQKVILPKIEANILEIKEVVEPEEQTSEESK